MNTFTSVADTLRDIRWICAWVAGLAIGGAAAPVLLALGTFGAVASVVATLATVITVRLAFAYRDSMVGILAFGTLAPPMAVFLPTYVGAPFALVAGLMAFVALVPLCIGVDRIMRRTSEPSAHRVGAFVAIWVGLFGGATAALHGALNT